MNGSGKLGSALLIIATLGCTLARPIASIEERALQQCQLMIDTHEIPYRTRIDRAYVFAVSSGIDIWFISNETGWFGERDSHSEVICFCGVRPETPLGLEVVFLSDRDGPPIVGELGSDPFFASEDESDVYVRYYTRDIQGKLVFLEERLLSTIMADVENRRKHSEERE